MTQVNMSESELIAAGLDLTTESIALVKAASILEQALSKLAVNVKHNDNIPGHILTQQFQKLHEIIHKDVLNYANSFLEQAKKIQETQNETRKLFIKFRQEENNKSNDKEG